MYLLNMVSGAVFVEPLALVIHMSIFIFKSHPHPFTHLKNGDVVHNQKKQCLAADLDYWYVK